MRNGLVLLLVLVATPSLASLPGQPLGCEDWVFLESGHSAASIDISTSWMPARVAIDAKGDVVWAETTQVPCPGCQSGTTGGLGLFAHVGGTDVLVAYVAGRSGSRPSTVDRVTSDREWPTQYGICPKLDTNSTCIATNIHTGEIFVSMRVIGEDRSTNPTQIEYDNIIPCRLSGFTRLFDVMASFNPSAAGFSLRVPAHPEALAAADRFDTYWGNVSRPLDLSHAHPLQCAYPDHQPAAGEYLTFPDAAPTPAPGNAVYYLTSVTYQGQTRAGRKALDGRLSGRDASRLPACTLDNQAVR